MFRENPLYDSLTMKTPLTMIEALEWTNESIKLEEDKREDQKEKGRKTLRIASTVKVFKPCRLGTLRQKRQSTTQPYSRNDNILSCGDGCVFNPFKHYSLNVTLEQMV